MSLPFPRNLEWLTFTPGLANGSLTGPNGSNFCKPLIRRKVYGLTGKTPPGASLLWQSNPLNPVWSKPVKASPTKSNRPTGRIRVLSGSVAPNCTQSHLVAPNISSRITHHASDPI
jgi:hypothetical protein